MLFPANLTALAVVGLLIAASPAHADEQFPYFGPGSTFPYPTDNLAQFFVEARCDDPAQTDISDCQAHPRLKDERVLWRRADWGSGNIPYFQVSEDWAGFGPRAPITQTWSYAPFLGFNASHGDGGQIVAVTDKIATILGTQDGGTSGVLWFSGLRCNGQGWREADLGNGNVLDGNWHSEVNNIGNSYDPGACPGLGQSYDQSLYTDVGYTFIIYGVPQYRVVGSIVSVHFNNGSVAASTQAERAFYGRGYGRLEWEAWARNGSGIPASPDMNQRCPGGWGPVADGWYKTDCRRSTQVIAAPDGWTGSQYSWGDDSAQ